MTEAAAADRSLDRGPVSIDEEGPVEHWPAGPLELRRLQLARGRCGPISLRVEAGAVAVVTGATGIGKTTLLPARCSALDPASAGEVLFGGVALGDAPAGPRGRTLRMGAAGRAPPGRHARSATWRSARRVRTRARSSNRWARPTWPPRSRPVDSGLAVAPCRGGERPVDRARARHPRPRSPCCCSTERDERHGPAVGARGARAPSLLAARLSELVIEW